MKCWFDTEFVDAGWTLQLVSIGIVADDGREYYAEHCRPESLTGWAREHIAPHMTGPRLPREQIAVDIKQFVGTRPEWWGYYAAHDWVVLCGLYGGLHYLPSGWPMFVRDVRALADYRGCQIGDDILPRRRGETEHNALGDARWTRRAWEWVRR